MRMLRDKRVGDSKPKSHTLGTTHSLQPPSFSPSPDDLDHASPNSFNSLKATPICPCFAIIPSGIFFSQDPEVAPSPTFPHPYSAPCRCSHNSPSHSPHQAQTSASAPPAALRGCPLPGSAFDNQHQRSQQSCRRDPPQTPPLPRNTYRRMDPRPCRQLHRVRTYGLPP